MKTTACRGSSRLWPGAAAAGAVVLSACAGYSPSGLPPRATLAQVHGQMGEPTARFPRADAQGGERLEYARGPFGKHTFMIDLDAAGHVERSEQVLREDVFQQVVPGMSALDLRYKLGRPSHREGIWRGASVWSWRYESPFCQWFRVTVEPSGVVRDAGYGPDPACEVNERDLSR